MNKQIFEVLKAVGIVAGGVLLAGYINKNVLKQS